MKQALILVLLLWGAFCLTVEALSFDLAAAIGFSAITMIAFVNCVTFLWLWYVRATPLALGMALSWAGQAAITVWWFISVAPEDFSIFRRGALLLLLLSFYIVGGGLHILVIQHSSESVRSQAILPAIAVIAIIAGLIVAL